MRSQRALVRCEHCSASFNRKEHLERHLRLHSGSKPFRCDFCSKAFPRSDTLLRHRAIHTRNSSQSHHRRNNRACDACANAKQRCEGGRPCARCSKGALACNATPLRQSSVIPPSSEISLTNTTTPADAVYSGIVPYVPGSAGDRASSSIALTPSDSHTVDLADILSPQVTQPTLELNGHLPASSDLSSLNSDLFAGMYEYAGGEDGFTSKHPFLWSLSGLEPFCPSILDNSFLDQSLSGGVSNAHSSDSMEQDLLAQSAKDLSMQHHAVGLTIDCPEFPEPQSDDLRIAAAEVYGHMKTDSDDCFKCIHAFYSSQRREGGHFIDSRLFCAFLELYFEHFDTQFPLLHHSTLQHRELSWILLLAVATIGSQYSEMRSAPAYTKILGELLVRAIRSNLPSIGEKPKMPLVQSLFLRDIGLLFDGSTRCQTMLQHERNILITLCRGLTSEFDGPRIGSEHYEDWVREEEKIRLLHCIYILDGFEIIFLGLPPTLTLSEFLRKRPCSEDLWRCQDSSKWHEMKIKEDCTSVSGPLASRVRLLGAYIEERIFFEQIRSSSLFKVFLTSSEQESVQNSITSSVKILRNVHSSEVTVGNSTTQDSVFHVVAILHHIPLRTIYGHLGWQTSETGMHLARERFGVFLHQQGENARKCLWHAVKIFTMLRNVRHSACYDAFSLCVAVNYILAYDRSAMHSAEGEIVRLDRAGSQVERWIQSGGDVRVHVTGVGVLNGSESRLGLLADAVKTLHSQVTWRSIAHGLATCFLQMIHGEMPSYGPE